MGRFEFPAHCHRYVLEAEGRYVGLGHGRLDRIPSPHRPSRPEVYDLLAAGLYERLGYETAEVIEGCPAGSAARWFRKELRVAEAFAPIESRIERLTVRQGRAASTGSPG